jgi:peroxiredoxin
MFDNFTRTSPKAGEMAPDFTLLTLDNEPFHLMEAAADKPVVIEFGSFT